MAESTAIRADLEAAAREEMARACTVGWRELSGCVPWGDSFDGFTPQGRAAVFERSYLWETDPGGDILVEVAVYEPRAFEAGVRLTRRLARQGNF